MIDTKRLRRIGHAVGLECGHNTGEMIKAAADHIDAQTVEIERLRTALNSMIDDMDIRARIRGDVENGVAVLDISDGVLDQARAALSGEVK